MDRSTPGAGGRLRFHGCAYGGRERLSYRATFDRVMRAGIDAGLSERFARTRVFHGFAAAAAGHIEPPAHLQDGDF